MTKLSDKTGLWGLGKAFALLDGNAPVKRRRQPSLLDPAERRSFDQLRRKCGISRNRSEVQALLEFGLICVRTISKRDCAARSTRIKIIHAVDKEAIDRAEALMKKGLKKGHALRQAIQELELAGKLKLGGDPSTDRKRIDRKWKRQRLVRALL